MTTPTGSTLTLPTTGATQTREDRKQRLNGVNLRSTRKSHVLNSLTNTSAERTTTQYLFAAQQLMNMAWTVENIGNLVLGANLVTFVGNGSGNTVTHKSLGVDLTTIADAGIRNLVDKTTLETTATNREITISEQPLSTYDLTGEVIDVTLTRDFRPGTNCFERTVQLMTSWQVDELNRKGATESTEMLIAQVHEATERALIEYLKGDGLTKANVVGVMISQLRPQPSKRRRFTFENDGGNGRTTTNN